jgi:uncharacterized protein with PIN domain
MAHGLTGFVVDAMLGRLARWLRAMGYDTLYPGPAPGLAGDRRLLQLARAEDRILVTRDRMLARLAEPRGCLVRSERVDDQLLEMVDQLGLAPEVSKWLSRCLECNVPLEARPRDLLRGLVPDHVFTTHAQFMGCPSCTRVYWAGTHAEQMLARLTRVLARSPGPSAAEPPGRFTEDHLRPGRPAPSP